MSFDQLFAWPILLLALGAMIIIYVVRRVVPQIDKSKLARRLMPLYPIAICVPVSLIPQFPLAEDWVSRVLTGLWAAFLSQFAYQLIRKVLAGKGINIPADPMKVDETKPTATVSKQE